MYTPILLSSDAPCYIGPTFPLDTAVLLGSGAAESADLSRPLIRLKHGDLEREDFILTYLPMVRATARAIHARLPRQLEFEDLVSAGVVGLLDAYSKYDFTKPVQFQTYARFRVRGAILDSLRQGDWAPRELRRKGRVLEERKSILTQELSRVPSEFVLATDMGYSLNEHQNLVATLCGLRVVSLQAMCTENSDGDASTWLPAAPDENPLLLFQKGESRQHLIDAMTEMSERHQAVLRLVYFKELTMTETGKFLNISTTRVSQIHADAIVHLRCLLVKFVLPVDRRGGPQTFMSDDRRTAVCKSGSRKSAAVLETPFRRASYQGSRPEKSLRVRNTHHISLLRPVDRYSTHRDGY